jgi:hypothetical protein
MGAAESLSRTHGKGGALAPKCSGRRPGAAARPLVNASVPLNAPSQPLSSCDMSQDR